MWHGRKLHDQGGSKGALVALCMAVLIAQIDTSVVNLAAKPIGHALGAQVSGIQWVVDAYNLSYAVLLLSGGLFADLYGRRRIFVTGAVVFTAASLLCAAAPRLGILIVGRALGGLGAALLLPSSLAIIRVLWTDAERGRVLGIWAACNGLAFAIGPTLGGGLIAWFGWRSIFLIVVPFALLAVVLAYRAIPESRDPHGRAFDAGAQTLGILALSAFAFGCIEGRNATLVLAASGGVAIVAALLFIKVERAKGDLALVPLSMFADARFRAAFLGAAAMTFGMYGAIFLVPLYWQSTALLTAAGSGFALLPMALIFVAASPFSGSIIERYGSQVATGGGLVLIALGLFTVVAGALATQLLTMIAGLGLTGLGMGMATGPLMGSAVGAAGPERSGTASSLINLARMLGATLGVAILGTIYGRLDSGSHGLSIALVIAAILQLAAAWNAWRHDRETPTRHAA